MDTIGSLDLGWAQGYNGSKADYINHNTLCYACGSNIKFYNTEDKKETVHPSPGEGINTIAVSGSYHVVAIAEQAINPRIFIHMQSGFLHKSICENGAQLEYVALAFSYSGRFLASYSGLPEFKLTIWMWETGEKLCSQGLNGLSCSTLSFNPIDWHKVCVAGNEQLSFWNIEQCNKKFLLIPSKVLLPAEDGTVDNAPDRITSGATNRAAQQAIKIDLPTKAGIVGEMAETFEGIKDDLKIKVVPVSHCWTAKGEVYVGCEGGQLLRVDSESQKVDVLFRPSIPSKMGSDELDGRPSTPITEDPESTSTVSPSYNNVMRDGSLTCMALHKDGLFVGGEDGTLRCLNIARNDISLADSWPLGSPITSLCFSTNYTKLAIGSPKGSIHLYDPNNPGAADLLFDHHHGNFVGVDVLAPGNQHCVTVREDGEVQVWSLDKPELVSSIAIAKSASSIACSPSSRTVAIGTLTGHVYFVEFSNVDNPRIITRLHIHHNPVSHLVYEQYGRYLLTGSDDGHIFIIDPRPSTDFKIMGHLPIEGQVMSISCNTPQKNGHTKVVVTANPFQDGKISAGHKIIQFDIKKDFIKDCNDQYYNSLKRDLKDEVINRMNLNFAIPSYGAAVAPGEIIYALSYNHKKLSKIQLPDEPPKKNTHEDVEEVSTPRSARTARSEKENNKASYLQPTNEFAGHELPGGNVLLSPHQEWIATSAPDGRLLVRAMDALDCTVNVVSHSYRTGGVKCTVFSSDSMYMMTCGVGDGTLNCYAWNLSASGKNKASSAIETFRTVNAALTGIRKKEDDVSANMLEWFPSASQPESRAPSVVEKETQEKSEKKKAMESDEIYTTPTPTPGDDPTWLELQEIEALKEEDKQYSNEKRLLRTEVRDLRRTIQSMMKENEVLPDTEQLAHHEFNLDVEEQQRLQAEGDAEVEQIHEDIEFENLAKIYLRDVIKQTCWDSMAVKGRSLKGFRNFVEVTNYPMRGRTKEEIGMLGYVSQQRQIEIAESEARKEIIELPIKPGTAGGDEVEDEDSEEGDGKEHPSTTGSLGAMYGGGNPLFYSQFELHTKQQKQNQIVLLKDAIYRIKTNFNKDFDEVYKMKDMEIARIKQKNVRIRKVLEDLNSKEEVWQPEWTIEEKPERLLTVDDSEVKVEKYISPEQRSKLEEEERKEEERLLREKGDNARERALDMMMGGVLEVKKEDELKKDIPVPAFMSKAAEEWSEEEKKQAAEYEKKVKELNEEREKYRKTLDAELKKIQTTLADTTANFDDKLTDLFHKKIKTEMVINQEELKIVRLQYSLLQEEELQTKEFELNRRLKSRQSKKNSTGTSVHTAKKESDSFRDTYDILVAEDKVLDKAFRREFYDTPAQIVDQLYKLFRRRPRGRRGAEPSMDVLVSGSPYGDRPVSPQQQLLNILKGLEDLDDESHMPEGVEYSAWQKMTLARRSKVESEQNVKQKALISADLSAFLQKRQEEDENLKAEIDELLEAQLRVQDEKLRFMCNLEIQFLLKQGQIEVFPGPFIYDHSDSILIHRGVVEDLNATIRQLGEQKIAAMTESKDFRKGIHVLEWEHKKNLMQIEDLMNKARDIQMLKVTRQLQAYLNDSNHESKIQQEIGKLEETLDLQDRHHEKNVRERKDILSQIRKIIRRKEKENGKLLRELQELNVSVTERKHINSVNADKHADSGAEKRMHDIVQRRKLVDLAKAQAQEVAVLRAEVERLRMRTFPALVQVEH